MSTGAKIEAMLRRNGWVLLRTSNHNVWGCPCGKHKTAISKTASDHRADKNKMGELRRMECPSLEKELPPPNRIKTKAIIEVVVEPSSPLAESGKCVICGSPVSRRNSYALAPGVRACRHHHGVSRSRMINGEGQ